jgi:hypothetical protein
VFCACMILLTFAITPAELLPVVLVVLELPAVKN